ncbi:ornithine cyclodeaminase [Photobacterium proteolyticum]|uniref:Ornithine cyclodeaminase n=1 Tax=Photobacterium proteolyticum TaxID=1903952 RepID=A0A1Q9H154_9GAMM|nr:ornithine cyclodeaminase [Photobacterium proteolyticum]OLQ81354.1 ornithine cyclodeaminase [Photobacterium proteolyticum]
MTLFLDVATLGSLVDEHGTEGFMAGLLDYMKSDFCRWEEFDKSSRTAAHSDIGVIELMPVADNINYGFKFVNGHPSNPSVGMSTVMAFGALADVSTGFPRLLSELTLSTALRTAVTSVMAAQALANPHAESMGMIGCGAQSEFQAIAFHTILGIKELRIFDIDPEAMEKVVEHLKDYPDLTVIKASSAKACVKGADIVTTVTADKAYATILTPDMIEPGMHINGVGGDCPGKTELHLDVLLAGKIFVEHEPQTRVEGDIQQLPAEHKVNPLWKVIAGLEHGRDSAEQITIFDSVGFALEDFSALRYIYDQAVEVGVGEKIELIPQLANPKDLFGLTKAQRAAIKEVA